MTLIGIGQYFYNFKIWSCSKLISVKSIPVVLKSYLYFVVIFKMSETALTPLITVYYVGCPSLFAIERSYQ